MSLEKYPVRKKHDFFNSIYSTFNSNYNPETRIFTKHCANFDFAFKEDKLHYIPDNRADVEGARRIFPNVKDTEINPNLRSVQDKISYYLSNRLVPVSYFITKIKNKLFLYTRVLTLVVLMNIKKKMSY